jgi:hypothetical protein
MVVMQIHDGATCEYSLRPSKSGLRLERSHRQPAEHCELRQGNSGSTP